MSESDVEENIVISSNDVVSWDEVLNKMKPNLKDLYFEESLNNYFIY